MNISAFIPTLNGSAASIKEHAHNILSIKDWFSDSEIAQALTLNKAIELVSQAYGFKSFAALKSKTLEQNLTISQSLAKQYQAINGDWADPDYTFLTCCDSYLSDLSDTAALTPIYAECTPLLRWAIDHSFYPEKMFLNLAVLNAFGVKMYRTRNDFSDNEVSLFHECNKNGAVRNLLRLNDDATLETYSFSLLTEYYGAIPLTLNALDVDFTITVPEPSKKQISNFTSFKDIDSLEWSSNFCNEASRFFQTDLLIYKQADDIHGGDEEGISCELNFIKPSTLKNTIGEQCIVFTDYGSLEINYNEKGESYSTLHNFQLHFCLYLTKQGFRFDQPIEKHYDTMTGLWRKAFIKHMEKHQYMLSVIWLEYASLDEKRNLATYIQGQVDMAANNVLRATAYEEYKFLSNIKDVVDSKLIDKLLEPIQELNPSSMEYIKQYPLLLKANSTVSEVLTKHMKKFTKEAEDREIKAMNLDKHVEQANLNKTSQFEALAMCDLLDKDKHASLLEYLNFPNSESKLLLILLRQVNDGFENFSEIARYIVNADTSHAYSKLESIYKKGLGNTSTNVVNLYNDHIHEILKHTSEEYGFYGEDAIANFVSRSTTPHLSSLKALLKKHRHEISRCSSADTDVCTALVWSVFTIICFDYNEYFGD